MYSTNTGQRTVTADITYWPVGHKDMAAEIESELTEEWDQLYHALLDRFYRTSSIDLRSHILVLESIRDLQFLGQGKK